MYDSSMIPVPTLWDLATIVIEEADRMCADETRATILAREALIHIIQGHVRNMEVEGCDAHAAAGMGRPGCDSCPGVLRR